jgi:predicted metallopeptidase
MSDPNLPLHEDGVALQALSEKMNVHPLKVIEVYRAEFKRLAAQSRIDTFISVLAMRNTRSLLRETQAHSQR